MLSLSKAVLPERFLLNIRLEKSDVRAFSVVVPAATVEFPPKKGPPGSVFASLLEAGEGQDSQVGSLIFPSDPHLALLWWFGFCFFFFFSLLGGCC